METEVAVDDAAATEEAADADDPAGEEAAKAAAAAAVEGSGDRTDDPQAAGVTGATPTAHPPPAAQPSRRCRSVRLRRAPARCILEGRRWCLHQVSLGVKLQGAGRRRN